MKTYIKFITSVFLKSFLNIFFIALGLVIILNLLSELDFFKNIDIDVYLPIYLSLLNSPSLIFDMFPFIFLISTQFFFIKFFKNNEIQVFKYSGLKNFSIIKILCTITFTFGIFITIFFYNISSNFKNFYLEIKSNYTSDDKYLAVITNNGLWIKDKIDNNTLIINASKIEPDFLINTFISVFDENFRIIKNIQSDKVNIKENEWIIYDANIFAENLNTIQDTIKIKSNFNYNVIKKYLHIFIITINLMYHLFYVCFRHLLNLGFSKIKQRLIGGECRKLQRRDHMRMLIASHYNQPEQKY